MLQHVAVEQPLSRIVGNECDADGFTDIDQFGIAPRRARDFFAVAFDDAAG